MNESSEKRLEAYENQIRQILTEVKIKNIISKWKREHPRGRKADCIRDTNLSEFEVYKYWRET